MAELEAAAVPYTGSHFRSFASNSSQLSNGRAIILLLRIGVFFGLLASSLVAANADHSDHTSQPMPVGKVYYPAGPSRRAPGILVIGGAEGGRAWAEAAATLLADDGYVALAEAYFNAPGLPLRLQLIPLERFRAGIDQLASDPRVDGRHIAVLGFSKGAEAALLIASRDPRIKAVVAGSPTDIIWQGIDRQTGSVVSSWTSAGIPLPFDPFASCAECKSLADLYSKSRDSAGSEGQAIIPVETVNGPVLMTASDRDGIWPSLMMADAIAERLVKKRFRYKVQTLRYPDGGHFTLGPLAPADADGDASFGGGTPKGVIAARRDSWPRVLSFLGHALRRAEPKAHQTKAR